MIGTSIKQAARFLREAQLVAIPTETVYGLAANALDPIAVSRIFEAKERPSFNPLIVHLAPDADPLDYVTEFPALAQKLADAFWPGPLSLLLPKRDIIPDIVTSGMDTVVLRKPAHPLTQQLLAELAFPLAAPSANKFKQISPTLPQHVERALGDAVAYVLDGGPAQVGLESTIVDCRTATPVVLRYGGISKEQIEAVVGPVRVSIKQHSDPLAPGQMDQHYSTTKPLFLVDSLVQALEQFPANSCSVLSFGAFPEDLPIVANYTLSQQSDLSEAASRLFELMHQADADDSERILVERLPDTGLGRAINDRLERAST